MKNKMLLTNLLIRILVLSACNSENTNIKNIEVTKKDVVTKDEQVNDLGWEHENPASPDAGNWEPVKFPDGAIYTLPPAPTNDSETTKKDLEELLNLATHRSEEDIQIIRRWEREINGPNTNWNKVTEEMVKKYKLSPPESARVYQILSGTIYTASVAAFDEKYANLRPRPTHLEPNLTLIEDFTVPNHPAYPSAHATTGWAASTVLAYLFPKEEEIFIAMAKESDLSRKLAGVHFESDNSAGKKLGTEIANDIIKGLKDDNAPSPIYICK